MENYYEISQTLTNDEIRATTLENSWIVFDYHNVHRGV